MIEKENKEIKSSKKGSKSNKKINPIQFNREVGLVINIGVVILGIVFRNINNIDMSVKLGDVGSIAKALLTSFSVVSGKTLIYIGLYGIVLSVVSKKESLKEFYTYYMVATILMSLGSLIYFVI